jgi:hypothetical protein
MLFCALLASLAASAWTWRRNQAAAELAEALPVVQQAGAAVKPRAPSAAAPALRAAAAAGSVVSAVDLFAPVSWEPPPPPPPPPPVAPVAEPQAPPLPFEYFGRTRVVGDAGAVLIHLRRGKEVFSVREGEQIDEQYRLDRIGAEALEIVYLPLSANQTLVTGAR